MTSGTMPVTHAASLSLLPTNGNDVAFTAETQRLLRVEAIRRAAMAFGMAALAGQAVDSGDYDQIDMMRFSLSELGEDLMKLADLFGQMTVQNAA